jgi:hypothetical protein
MTEQQLEFSWKYKDYELRACPERLVRFDNEPNETIDLVKWYTNTNGEKRCYSLAYWRKNDEGYYLHFVGNRPFQDILLEDVEVVWKALRVAQKVLDGWFELERTIND